MPGKPRKPIEGYLRVSELAAEGAKRGRPLSAAAIKRQILLGQIIPDKWEDRSYAPSALFSRANLDQLFLKLPTKKQPVPSSMTTTQALLKEVQKIKKRVYLAHIQQFLAREFEEARTTGNFSLIEGSYGEIHGKQRRLVFPKKLGEKFLSLARQDGLNGLFAGQPHTKKPVQEKKPKSPQPKAPPKKPVQEKKPSPQQSKKPPKIQGKKLELKFSDLGSQYKPEIVRGRLSHRLYFSSSGQNVPEIAKIMGTTEGAIQALVRTKQLEMKNGQITRESLVALLKQIK